MAWFSSTAEYALRSLSHLAERGGEDPAILGRDLAELTQIPANYLSKILLTLNRAGIVEATRGLGGGYRLRRPASEVYLAEVLELFDPPEGDSACFLGGGRVCSAENPCPAHDRWRLVRQTYLDFTRNTTLAEIARPAAER
ncbi:MAG: Rrf2 family transcriptional regulator [Thermoanaerobaculia bacterium]